MTVLILADRAEMYFGTKSERITAYYKNRKREYEEISKFDKNALSFEDKFPEAVELLLSLKD